MLNRLKQIAIFCQVIDSGSMRAAATTLGMTPPAVSQHIKQLEQELGLSLIHRSTRSISLSEAGSRYYQHGKKMLAAAEDAEDAVNEVRHTLEGELRLSAPVGLAAGPLAQALQALMAQHPGLRLTILASDHGIDLVSEQIDIAIRVGQPRPSALIYHPLGETHWQIYASPAYLQRQGNPVRPDALADHRWLGLLNHSASSLTLQHPHQPDATLSPHYQMRFDNMNVLVNHAQHGLGLAVLPALEVQHLVQAGLLVPVLPGWTLDSSPLYALTISRQNPYKVKAVLNALQVFFAQPAQG